MENGLSAHLVGDEPTASGRQGQPTVDSQGRERNEGIDGLLLKRLTRLADHRASLVPFLDATPGLLAIPPGVWHADQNWGDTDARVLNFPTIRTTPMTRTTSGSTPTRT